MTTPAKPAALQGSRKDGSSHIPSPHPEPEQSPAGGELERYARDLGGVANLLQHRLSTEQAGWVQENTRQAMETCREVAAALARQAPAPSGDWVMVPREPTEDMLLEGEVQCRRETVAHKLSPKRAAADAYRVMIAAAPAPSGNQDADNGKPSGRDPHNRSAVLSGVATVAAPAPSGRDEPGLVEAVSALGYDVLFNSIADAVWTNLPDAKARGIAINISVQKFLAGLTARTEALSRQAASAAGGGE